MDQEERIKKSEEIRKRFPPGMAPFFTKKPTFYLDMQEMMKDWDKVTKETHDPYQDLTKEIHDPY